MAARAVLPVGLVLAALDGRKPSEAVRLLRLLAEASIPPPAPLPLFQPGFRWIGVEWQTFRCERLRCSMPVRDCLEIRGAVWPSGKRKGCPKRRECQGCPVGEENAARVPAYPVKPPSQAPEVLPFSQRMAKRARALVGLEDDEVVRVDPMREAATLACNPDDPNDWRA